MKRRDLLIGSAGVPFLGFLQGCGGGSDVASSEYAVTSSPGVQFSQQSAYRYLGQSDFANSVDNLLYAGGGSPSIDAFDPYWVDAVQNTAAVGSVTGSVSNAFDSSGRPVVRLLKAGSPYVDLASYTGLASPNTPTYRACTAGVSRATGVQLDASGRVGMFINGFDTPSDYLGGGFKSFGPDIHISRSRVSDPIYVSSAPSQCLHMACTLSLGHTYFSPAAGASRGVGGQIGWRASFVRQDRGEFRAGVKEIVLLVGLWESRSVGDIEFDGKDMSVPKITQGEYWVAGTLAAGQTSQFVENYGASMMTGVGGWRKATFYWNISRSNMVNILHAFEADNTSPEDVRLSGTTFNGELYDNRPGSAQFKPGQFGFYFEGQTVDVW